MLNKIIDMMLQFLVNNFNRFLGCLLFSDYHKLPQKQLYGALEEDVNIPLVKKCLSSDSYLSVKKIFI